MESVLVQDHDYDDQKAKATMTIYQKNFQTVSNKLLETKLEEVEAIPSVSNTEAIEVMTPNIVVKEIAAQEQVHIDDTISSTRIPTQISFDVATPEVQQIEPCIPISNMPEEYCDDLQQSYVDMVNIILYY